MRILIIDNHDSFVYNLYHLTEEAAPPGTKIKMAYNDVVTVAKAAEYDRIIISPGPGLPLEAGRLMEIVRELSHRVPMLGICLGHQAIAQSFGARLRRIGQPLHGIQDEVRIVSHGGLFRNLPETIIVGRYHSWDVSADDMPDTLEVTAVDGAGRVMAVSHRRYDVHGVQFHPESFLTPYGTLIIRNFLHAQTRNEL